MKNIQITLTLLASFFFTTCSLPAQSTESRSVSDFSVLSISGNFEMVYLEKGTPGVKLKGSQSDLDKIEVENKGKNLQISLKKRKNLKGKVYIYVSFEELERIANSGASDFKTTSTISGEDLSLAFSGSGDFEGSVDVENLKIAISGSSDFDLEGHATRQKIAISGSGDIDASDLRGEQASVAISGSGDVDLNVSGNVKSAISGSGDVSNRGN